MTERNMPVKIIRFRRAGESRNYFSDDLLHQRTINEGDLTQVGYFIDKEMWEEMVDCLRFSYGKINFNRGATFDEATASVDVLCKIQKLLKDISHD